MELVDLRAFLAVAAATSFRRAAETTGVQQSTLSRRVRKLEDEVGVSLFERRSTGVKLTYAGRDFLDVVRNSLFELDRGAERAADAGVGRRGQLCIGVFASIAAGPVRQSLEAFRIRHPDVAITMRERPTFFHAIDLTERRLDVAFMMSQPMTSDLRSECLWSERLCLAVREDSLLAYQGAAGLDEIAKETMLLCNEDQDLEIYAPTLEMLRREGKSITLQVQDVTRETLMALIASGLGVALVNEHASKVQYPGVRFVPIAGETRRLHFRAVWSEKNDNPALRRFLSTVRAVTSGRPMPNLD